MAAVDRDKLLAFLRERVESRNVTETSGLVIASVYQGMVTRILSGEFDGEHEDRCDFDCDYCRDDRDEDDDAEVPHR